jgi:hypothetical protein
VPRDTPQMALLATRGHMIDTMDVDGAPGSPWVAQLGPLISGPELDENELIAQEAAVVAGVRASGDGILAVLQPLGAYLTTENDTPRAKAIALLAKVHSIPLAPPSSSIPRPQCPL